MKTDYSDPKDQEILREILITALAFIESYPEEYKHVAKMRETILKFIKTENEN